VHAKLNWDPLVIVWLVYIFKWECYRIYVFPFCLVDILYNVIL